MKIYLYPLFTHFHKPNIALQMCILVNITCHIFFYHVLWGLEILNIACSTITLPKINKKCARLELMLRSSGPPLEL